MNPLSREIADAKVAPGSLRIWWIGQEGFVVKSPRQIIYIDPYLSDYAERITRGQPNEHVLITPPPLRPEDVDHADLVLCTHDHADHIDPDGIPVIAKSSPRARFVVPRCALDTMLRLGVSQADSDACRRRLPADRRPGDSRDSGDARAIRPTSAARFSISQLHYKLDGLSLFHAGDTIPYDGQVERVIAHRIDLAFVPINGRDDFRHSLAFEGNFTCGEAVAFAAAVRAGLTIPMHYDKFTLNTGDVDEFRRLARSVVFLIG